MSILKTRKSKKFGYAPRYYENDGEGSPFEIEHKFDRYRTTVGPNKGIAGKFRSVFSDLKQTPNFTGTKIILVIVAILVLAFLFIIDFDLSIF
ncbi:MAG: hypothetical protein ACI86C_001101 [Candidatus Latescibacterota bacterium]|jgi:hypothetical protein